jgi:hypothetical protein
VDAHATVLPYISPMRIPLQCCSHKSPNFGFSPLQLLYSYPVQVRAFHSPMRFAVLIHPLFSVFPLCNLPSHSYPVTVQVRTVRVGTFHVFNALGFPCHPELFSYFLTPIPLCTFSSFLSYPLHRCQLFPYIHNILHFIIYLCLSSSTSLQFLQLHPLPPSQHILTEHGLYDRRMTHLPRHLFFS